MEKKERLFIPEPDTFRKYFVFLHWGALTTLLGLLTFKALFRFSLDSDYLEYHLPEALSFFGMTTFRPGPKFRMLLDGHPPLAHILQGVLVLISGRISTANGLSALAFLSAVFLLFRTSRQISIRWFLTGFLGIPILLIHYISGYIDLFSNLLVFAAFLMLFTFPVNRRHSALVHTCLFLVFVLAGHLSKFQMWPISWVLSFFMFLKLMRLSVKGRIGLPLSLIFLALLIAVNSVWAVRNTIKFDNPTYPVAPPFLEKAVTQPLPWSSRLEAGLMPGYFQKLPRILRFFYSLFEVNSFQFNAEYHWSIDQWNGPENTTPHHHLGGFFWLSMLLHTAVLSIAMATGKTSGSDLLPFFCAVMCVSLLPMNFYLRYWQFIPLILCFHTAFALPRLPIGFRQVIKGALLLSAMIVCFSLPEVFQLDLPDSPAEAAPIEVRSFWAEASVQPEKKWGICPAQSYAIFWSGPNLNEFKVQGCY